jgi:glutamate racemase
LGAKAVVVACNSASTAGLDQIREVHPGIPVIGVEPAVKPAHNLTRNGKIGVLATELTLQGAKFSDLVEKYGSDIEVYTQPAPGLVKLVEAGRIAVPETERLLRRYLEPLLEKGVDTLVLGCTHYPFLRPLIQKIGGPGLAIVDTGVAVAKQTARVLEQKQLANPGSKPGGDTFYTSGDPETVGKVVQLLWQSGREIALLKAGV